MGLYPLSPGRPAIRAGIGAGNQCGMCCEETATRSHGLSVSTRVTATSARIRSAAAKTQTRADAHTIYRTWQSKHRSAGKARRRYLLTCKVNRYCQYTALDSHNTAPQAKTRRRYLLTCKVSRHYIFALRGMLWMRNNQNAVATETPHADSILV